MHKLLLISFTLIYGSCVIGICPTTEKIGECYHGQPVDDTCVCDIGWDGTECQNCEGRIVVEGESGCISEGNYDFLRLVNCGWLIKQDPAFVNRTLKISILSDQVSCNGVTLQIFDGEGVFAPLLASYSGTTAPGSGFPREVIATSGFAFFAFQSEAPLTLSGYNISFEYTSDDYQITPNEMSVATNVTSSSDWMRYSWQSLLAQGRGSASAALIDNSTYVFGGQILGDSAGRVEMLRFDIANEAVEEIVVNPAPELRFGHSVATFTDSFLMYGGLMSTNFTVTNEFWKFNATTQSWQEIALSGTPPPLFGHTAHALDINGKTAMIIIFGFHPEWRYSNFVFQIDLDTNSLERVSTTGAIPPGVFGHASAFDPDTKQIFVQGGRGYNVNQQTDFYAFHVEQNSWKILLPIPSNTRYLHSMAFMDDAVFVYGGRRVSGSGICPVMPFESYDSVTGYWKDIDYNFTETDSRYGHSMVVNEALRTMSLFGGFDGIMHSDVVTYSLEASRNSCGLSDGQCAVSPFCEFDGENCTTASCVLTEEECNTFCSRYLTCSDCLSTSVPCCNCSYSADCRACLDANQADIYCNETISDVTGCDVNATLDYVCASLKTCFACDEMDGCQWQGSSCTRGYEEFNCTNSILELIGCENCTTGGSNTWCETTGTCLNPGDMAVYYPYDTCTDVRRSPQQCNDPCSVHTNCDDCHQSNLLCGWCSENGDTGLGSCMSGYLGSPLAGNSCQGNWSYELCPACQCNGHSACVNRTVCYDCDSDTSGENCQVCDDGFYGSPVNGGNCSECQCNDHATTCDFNGKCDCDVYGTVGDQCETCRPGMYGDAVNNTCYYLIDPGYRYQFALPQTVSKMNFNICPSSSADLMVTIDSGGSAYFDEYFNATFTYNSTGAWNETVFAIYKNVTYAREILRNSEIHFSSNGRICVNIYMEFKPGFSFVITLQRYGSSLALVMGVFFTVFLLLLIGVAVFWKLHTIWLRYNRRRQREVELTEMAARPYSCIDFDYSDDYKLGKNPAHFTTQSISGAGASVGSVLLWIPYGDQDDREPQIAVGSALVKSKVTRKEKSKKTMIWNRNRDTSGFDNPVLEIETPDIERNISSD